MSTLRPRNWLALFSFFLFTLFHMLKHCMSAIRSIYSPLRPPACLNYSLLLFANPATFSPSSCPALQLPCLLTYRRSNYCSFAALPAFMSTRWLSFLPLDLPFALTSAHFLYALPISRLLFLTCLCRYFRLYRLVRFCSIAESDAFLTNLIDVFRFSLSPFSPRL